MEFRAKFFAKLSFKKAGQGLQVPQGEYPWSMRD